VTVYSRGLWEIFFSRWLLRASCPEFGY